MELEPGATITPTVVVDESMTADRFGNTGVQGAGDADAGQ
jgi:hypothetical protein